MTIILKKNCSRRENESHITGFTIFFNHWQNHGVKNRNQAALVAARNTTGDGQSECKCMAE